LYPGQTAVVVTVAFGCSRKLIVHPHLRLEMRMFY